MPLFNHCQEYIKKPVLILQSFIKKQHTRMIFAEALGEDDEYVRLQKISLGIKEVSFYLRNMQIITDHNILKSMICSYPFQTASIELLMSAFFDYFKHRLFLLAFYRALQEVSELQEYREFLGNRSTRNLKMAIKQQIDNKFLVEMLWCIQVIN